MRPTGATTPARRPDAATRRRHRRRRAPHPEVVPLALEQFIEITGVQGEASAPDVRSAIPVLSWSFGIGAGAAPNRLEPAGPAGGDLGPAAPVAFSGFRFTKRVDSSTPLLMDLCARRNRVSQARLVVRNTGHRDPRVVVDLREVTVGEIRTGFDDGAGDLVENVTLCYGRVWFGGAVVDRRGSSEQVNWFAWDLEGNRPAAGE